MGEAIVGINGQQVQQQINHTTTIRGLPVIDPSKMKPTRYNILLKVFGEGDITEGGIFRSESDINKTLMDKVTCELVACGEWAFTNNGVDWPVKPKVGDTVFTSKYAGNLYRDEDFNLYRHAHDEDVCFVVEGE